MFQITAHSSLEKRVLDSIRAKVFAATDIQSRYFVRIGSIVLYYSRGSGRCREHQFLLVEILTCRNTINTY